MKRFLRWSGIAALTVLALAVVAAAVVFIGSQVSINHRYEARKESLAAASAALVADASRQARLLGCVTCHGEGLQGKLIADIPGVARLHAPNLTELARRVTDQQLAQAIRQGLGADGRALWMMPAHLRLGDAETAALISWMRSLPPSAGGTDGVTFRPIGRVAIVTGKLKPIAAFSEEQRARMPVDLGAAHAAGRLIATNVCAICHGPALQGQPTQEGARAPDLTIADAYSLDQFRTLMRTGKGLGNRELAEMSGVARESFALFTDSEIAELHAYLVARGQRFHP